MTDVEFNDTNDVLYVTSPHFEYGKGFAFMRGDNKGNPESIEVAAKKLESLGLCKPTAAQVIHALGFIPGIRDEEIQRELMLDFTCHGVFSFDECYLDPGRAFSILYQRDIGHRECLTRLVNSDWFDKKYMGEDFRLGVDPILDFILGKKGIRHVREFLRTSGSVPFPKALEYPMHRQNSGSAVCAEEEAESFLAMLTMIPAYYNEVQFGKVGFRFTANKDFKGYNSNRVKGTTFLWGNKSCDYSNSPDYIPQLDPMHRLDIILNFCTGKSTPRCYALGIIPE